MRVLSLFSGVGGFDLGLEAAGMETVGLCEIDRNCRRVLRRRWPTVPIYEDVSDLTADRLLADGVIPDVVAFGSPCQDLSVAGKRAGLDGERSGLFRQAMRIIRELQEATDGNAPTWAIWENVPGALTSAAGRDFGAVLDEMADARAMVIEWAVLDAQNFGVAQRRRRVFLVARLNPRGAEFCPEQILPLWEGSPRDPQTRRSAWKATAGASEASTRGSRSADLTVSTFQRQAIAQYREADLASAIRACDSKEASDLVVVDHAHPTDVALFPKERPLSFDTQFGSNATVLEDVAPTLKATQTSPSVMISADDTLMFDGTRVGDFRVYTETAPTLKQRMGTGGGQVPHVAQPIPTENREADVASALWARPIAFSHYSSDPSPSEDVSPTLRSGTNVCGHSVAQPIGFSHTQGLDCQPSETAFPTLRREGGGHAVAQAWSDMMAVRRLTPLECERLMGWPEEHTRWADDGSEIADTHRYRMCGNGVASPCAEWVGRQILRAEASISEGLERPL